jgi:hypothetical protein
MSIWSASKQQIVSILNNLSESFGGKQKLSVVDDEANHLLSSILKELKIINVHLAEMSGELVTKDDV